MIATTLISLALLFGALSLVSFGGGNAVLGAMQRAAVDRHHWLTDRQFLDLFALSRAAPGPGSLIAALVGEKAAGLPGALVATLAMMLPSSLVVLLTSSWARRHPASSIRVALERALAPVAIGLTVGSALLLMRHDQHGFVFDLLTAVATALFVFTPIHPLAVLLGCGVVSLLL